MYYEIDARFGAGTKENTPHNVRRATWKRQLAAVCRVQKRCQLKRG